MKRLFNVKFNGSNFFENKMEAKAFRDAHPGTKVSRGPDHMGKHGSRGVPHKHAYARRYWS